MTNDDFKIAMRMVKNLKSVEQQQGGAIVIIASVLQDIFNALEKIEKHLAPKTITTHELEDESHDH